MAKFESSWRGKVNPRGEELGSDDLLMEVTAKSAKVFRALLMQYKLDEELPLRQVTADFMAAADLKVSNARQYRVRVQYNFGLIYLRKEGIRYWTALTDRGVDFVNWMIHDKDGQKWGTDSNIFLSKEEKRRYEEAFIIGDDSYGKDGGLAELSKGVVQWNLSEWGLVLDERIPRPVWMRLMRRVKDRGFRTVFVPDGYEVYVREVVGDRKRAHRVGRWSDFPVMDKRVIMDGKEEVEEAGEKEVRGDDSDGREGADELG